MAQCSEDTYLTHTFPLPIPHPDYKIMIPIIYVISSIYFTNHQGY